MHGARWDNRAKVKISRWDSKHGDLVVSIRIWTKTYVSLVMYELRYAVMSMSAQAFL